MVSRARTAVGLVAGVLAFAATMAAWFAWTEDPPAAPLGGVAGVAVNRTLAPNQTDVIVLEGTVHLPESVRGYQVHPKVMVRTDLCGSVSGGEATARWTLRVDQRVEDTFGAAGQGLASHGGCSPLLRQPWPGKPISDGRVFRGPDVVNVSVEVDLAFHAAPRSTGHVAATVGPLELRVVQAPLDLRHEQIGYGLALLVGGMVFQWVGLGAPERLRRRRSP